MNDIDECNEELQKFVNSVISAACKMFEEFCKLIKEFLKYLSEILYSSEWWMYTQSWFEACAKNPKSFHYMRRCKKCRIRKKHTDCIAKEAFKIYEERREMYDSL